MDGRRLLDSFLEMVAIESPSTHEAAMAAYCKDVLESLGFAVRFDDSASKTGSDTGNLIAYLPGTAPGHIAFSSHMDTVLPCDGIEAVIVEEEVEGDGGVVVEEVIRAAGGRTILGSDDKSGIAAIFEGIRSTLEKGAPHPAITVAFSVMEELSVTGAKYYPDDVFLPSGPGSDEPVPCFVLDADGDPGTIIMGAPYHYSFVSLFQGRAAHAGVEPEMGRSAIQMAASAIEAMPLGRLDECTTANVGPIEGGVATNIVAAECRLEGECRSLYADRVLNQRDAMTRALEAGAAKYEGSVEVSWHEDYPGILFSENDAIVKHLVRAIEACGLKPRFVHSGGGADANVLGTKGACAITLGTGMTNFHTPEEHILVRHLEEDARLVEAIIAEYAA